ncbi:uncharacterized protein LOC120013703 isoform X1 [Tripterygium wilfordii]|uniref:uncharacterized protein LOC120013703 isoform X1 n=1 Tax=Tripterygium wilfordii TaxID=458696 RepID=UPI0018F7F45B|nr:uncharacterized protein LOC120013703 isoform X1 [Tripterygium wilfordii]
MASSHNVELEAAKFLQKLIQDSKDEPARLATKLHVILQHMKASGKEHSMPYQVISRAMETVINQHGLDIEALKSSRLPLTGGSQMVDSASAQYAAGSSQPINVTKDPNARLAENDTSKGDPFSSSRPHIGPVSGGHDGFQGSGAHRIVQSFDHESPSSLDTRSANSQSQERRDPGTWDKKLNQKDGKKSAAKRKRGDSSLASEPFLDRAQQGDIQNDAGNLRKGKMNKVEKSVESGRGHGGMPVTSRSSTTFSSGKALEHDDGSSAASADANKIFQGGRQASNAEMPLLRSSIPRDAGKAPLSLAPALSGMPFKEHQLRQLRAQCLVFLGFRNGLMPKKLHLEIALGSIFPKEGGNTEGPCKELTDHKGKAQSSNEPSGISEAVIPFGRLNSARDTDKIPPGISSTGQSSDADVLLKESGTSKIVDKNSPSPETSVIGDERKHILGMRKLDSEMQNQEPIESRGFITKTLQQPDVVSECGIMAAGNSVEGTDQGSVMAINKQVNTEVVSWTGIGCQNEVSRAPSLSSSAQHEFGPERKENASNPFQGLNNSSLLGKQYADSHSTSFTPREQWKSISGIVNDNQRPLPARDGNEMMKHMPQDDPSFSELQKRYIADGCKVVPVDNALKHGTLFTTEPDEGDKSISADSPPCPKYTMLEKWVMDQQKKKLLLERNWVLKQRKTQQRIATCFDKLKENVSSSEDISARTKSVIELKKLQLLELQRRLRSDFLNDFFKPIANDMDRLKSYKKHKHGRRIKQLEKFEQKMKEERQKIIRERQKEFFGEIEVHKERLDDVFKIKRERWKGFNKFVREFHKRKERFHREKIDRIQREKINLLKINDVEGYLRMVQDAKSDRVKQLLKETEKYLQKLGSRLQEAKTIGSHFENDMDETRTLSTVQKNETIAENEDESDQAKHYMESNEKYYFMAHSIKENITDQPTSLQGGKLREYQMNGLRWLVSLYNNHLNGILADEMGLGKTVQVIALMCYLMETKNDRGPFLVVVPSSVLPGWESEINLWAPGVHKIVYSGPPEERRRLFKERILHQKFNVLLTTYEYLMNKHDRPKLSKVHWHYIIIDEGHRIKNASCKLNAELKHYRSSHRLLLTGTPLQNNLEELWALLNFLLPNIFNSSEDFSQWFNKPFEGNGDNSADEALLSEEENLLIINRLHQVLRPFVLRRLKQKVENQLPEKIERLIRCEASAYQKLLMKRVEENLGSIGNSKARSVHNSVMELRNICNHPYLSQLHAEEVDNLIPKHYLPPVLRLCGKLEMLDRLLPKLKATDHRVLFFSTMTRLLDVMEEYLTFKQYQYLRLDGHTSGNDRGPLIDKFNKPNSPYFIFLLSIRAGGVGVNLQAADTVIIFDTDWNPQVDLQAQARAHRIGQKREVLVLRFETVKTVEEQVRAAAEHKLGVANQSITAGFFDNNTSAEDRREYLESLLRESKKEEDAPVLDDDSLNDVLARNESEIDVFESVDKRRREEEMAAWKKLVLGERIDGSEPLPPLPSRLVTTDDLKEFYEVFKLFDAPKAVVASDPGAKRKGEKLGALDTREYGRGKRAREVRSYEEQWTEEEFEKLCQADSPGSPKLKEEVVEQTLPRDAKGSMMTVDSAEPHVSTLLPQPQTMTMEPLQVQQTQEVTPSKRGRGRPRRATSVRYSAAAPLSSAPSGTDKVELGSQKASEHSVSPISGGTSMEKCIGGTMPHSSMGIVPISQPTVPILSGSHPTPSSCPPVPVQSKGQNRRVQSGGHTPRRRGKRQEQLPPATPDGSAVANLKMNEQSLSGTVNSSNTEAFAISGTGSSIPTTPCPDVLPFSSTVDGMTGTSHHSGVGIALISQPTSIVPSVAPIPQSSPSCPSAPSQIKGQSRKTQSGAGAPRRRGRKQESTLLVVPNISADQNSEPNPQLKSKVEDSFVSKNGTVISNNENDAQDRMHVIQELAGEDLAAGNVAIQDKQSTKDLDHVAQKKHPTSSSTTDDSAARSVVMKGVSPQNSPSKAKSDERRGNAVVAVVGGPVLSSTAIEVIKNQSSEDKSCTAMSNLKNTSPVLGPSNNPSLLSNAVEGSSKTTVNIAPTLQPILPSLAVASATEPVHTRRQGRKAPNKVEAPKRRGRKHGSVLPATSDGSAGQDPKLHLPSTGSKAIAPRSKDETDPHELLNTISVNASEAHFPGGQDPKRKETSVPPGFGRIQTADVNDVARVMKEIFSETCLSRSRIGETSGNEGTVAPAVCVPGKAPVEVVRDQIPEDESLSSMPSSGTAVLLDNVSMQTDVYHSGSESDAKVIESKTPISGEPAFSSTDASNHESKSAAGSVQNVMYSRNLFHENSTMLSIVEAIDAGHTAVESSGNEGERIVEVSRNKQLEDKESLDVSTVEASMPVINPPTNNSEKLSEPEAHAEVEMDRSLGFVEVSISKTDTSTLASEKAVGSVSDMIVSRKLSIVDTGSPTVSLNAIESRGEVSFLLDVDGSGSCAGACNTVDNPLKATASWPDDESLKSADAEVIPIGHIGTELKPAECDHVEVLQTGEILLEVHPSPLKDIAEESEAQAVTQLQVEDGSSNVAPEIEPSKSVSAMQKVLPCSLEQVPQKLEYEVGERTVVSNVGSLLQQNITENIDVSSGSLVTEEKESERSARRAPACTSVMEVPKWSEAETVDQMDFSHSDRAPEGVSAKLFLSSEPLKDEEKFDGFSGRTSIDREVRVEKSQGLEDDVGDRVNLEQVGVIVNRTISQAQNDMFPTLGPLEENKIDSSDRADLDVNSVELAELKGSEAVMGNEMDVDSSEWKDLDVYSVKLVERKGSEAEMGNEMDASQVGGIAPKDVSVNMCLPSPRMMIEGEKFEGSSGQSAVNSSSAQVELKGFEGTIDDHMDVSRVDVSLAENVIESIDTPSSSPVKLSDSAAVEEPKLSDSEMGDQFDTSRAGGTMPKGVAEKPVPPASPPTVTEPEMGDKFDASLAGGTVPKGVAEKTVRHASPSTVEEKFDSSIVDGSKGSVMDMNTSPTVVNVTEDMSDDGVPPISLATEENVTENVSDNEVPPSISLATEEKETSGNEGTVAPAVCVPGKAPVEVVRDEIPEDESLSSMPSSGTAILLDNVSMQTDVYHSGSESDAKVIESKTPISGEPAFSSTDASNHESKSAAGSVQNVMYSRNLFREDSTMLGIVEAIDAGHTVVESSGNEGERIVEVSRNKQLEDKESLDVSTVEASMPVINPPTNNSEKLSEPEAHAEVEMDRSLDFVEVSISKTDTSTLASEKAVGSVSDMIVSRKLSIVDTGSPTVSLNARESRGEVSFLLDVDGSGSCAGACNTVDNPLKATASWPDDESIKSADAEVIPIGHFGTELKPAECDHVEVLQTGEILLEVHPSPLKDIAEESEAQAVTQLQVEDGSSKDASEIEPSKSVSAMQKVLPCSLEQVPQKLEYEVGERTVVSNVGSLLQQNITENIDVSSGSLVTEEKESERSARRALACTSVMEVPKWSEAETVDQMDFFQSDRAPEGVSAKLFLSSEPLKDEEKFDGFSGRTSMDREVRVEKSQGLEDDVGDRVNLEQVGVIVNRTISQAQNDIFPTLGPLEENKIDSSDRADLDGNSVELAELKGSEAVMGNEMDVDGSEWKDLDVYSVKLVERKGSEAEMGNEMDASQVGGIAPKDVSVNMCLPSPRMMIEGEKFEGSSGQSAVNSSSAQVELKGFEGTIDDHMDVSRVDVSLAENVIESIDPPSSSPVKLSDSAAMEEPKLSDSEMGDQFDASRAGGTMPKGVAGKPVLPASPPTVTEPEMGDKFDASLAGGTVPKGVAEKTVRRASPSTVEEKFDSSIVDGSKGSVMDMNTSPTVVNVTEDMSDDGVPPISLATEENVTENASDNEVPPSISLATGEKETEVLSGGLLCRSVDLDESRRSEAVNRGEMGVSKVDLVGPSSSFTAEEEIVEDASGNGSPCNVVELEE